MTIPETVENLKSGKTTSVQLVKNSIDTFEADKKSALPLNAFLEMYDDAAAKAEAEAAAAATENAEEAPAAETEAPAEA